ncbi:MAG: pyridoxamine 5'-phosphate oxidase family protein [Nocardioidaceae bacterium]
MSRLDDNHTGGLLQELTQAECFELIGAKSVGRIAFSGDHGPVVLPVNYVLDSGTVLFRTSPYTTIATALRDTPAAFEVDDVDDFLQSGWSVLVQGHAAYVDDDAELPSERFNRPEPWVDGARTLYIRVTPQTITGRRIHPR